MIRLLKKKDVRLGVKAIEAFCQVIYLFPHPDHDPEPDPPAALGSARRGNSIGLLHVDHQIQTNMLAAA